MTTHLIGGPPVTLFGAELIAGIRAGTRLKHDLKSTARNQLGRPPIVFGPFHHPDLSDLGNAKFFPNPATPGFC